MGNAGRTSLILVEDQQQKMAISLYDQCTTTDWENIALRISQLSAAVALLLSVVALSLGTAPFLTLRRILTYFR